MTKNAEAIVNTVGAYRTQTNLKNSKNITCDKAWVIAIDIGYSSVKVMSAGGIYSFPAFALRSDQMRDIQKIGETKKSDIEYLDEKGIRWSVGELALAQLPQNDTSFTDDMMYSRDRYLSDMFKVIARVGISLGLIGRKEDDTAPIVIQTGLPPAFLHSDGNLLRQALAGKHQFKSSAGDQWIERSFTLSEKNIRIMSQPMGSLYGLVFDDKCAETELSREYLNNNILVFDGGMGTLDTFEIKNRSTGKSQSFQHLGMRIVLGRVCERLMRDYKVEVTTSSIQPCLRRGSVVEFDSAAFTSKEIPISKIVEEESQKVFEEAMIQIRQSYHNLLDYKYLIVTGGTGAAWFDKIKEYCKNLKTLEVVSALGSSNLPEIFANVRGYYLSCVNKINKSK